MLVIKSDPDEREGLRGYLLRLSSQNGYTHPQWLMSVAFPSTKRADPARFAEVCGVDLGSLAPLMRGRHVRCFGHVPGHEVDEWGFRGNPRVCPCCVKDEGLQFAIWDLQFCTGCPIHGCRLLETCPDCGRPWRWDRRHVGECGNAGCEFQIAKAATEALAPAECALAAWLFGIWLPRYREGVDGRWRESLDLGLNEAMHLMRLLGVPASRAGDLSLHDVKKDPYGTVSRAAAVLSDWPNGLRTYLAEVRSHAKSQAGLSVRRTYGRLISRVTWSGWVGGRTPEKVCNLLTGELKRAIDQDTAQGAAPMVFRGLASPEPQPSTWINMKVARTLSGMSEKALERSIELGHLRGEVLVEGCRRRFRIDRADLDRLVSSRRSIGDQPSTKAGLAEVLGVAPPLVVSLAEAGFIASRKTGKITHYSMKDAEALLAAIYARCVDDPFDEATAFSHSTLGSSVATVDVIRLAAEGGLPVRVGREQARGLRRFDVDRAALRGLLDAARSQEPEMTRQACIERLVCSEELLDHLSKLGILRTSTRLSSRGTAMILPESVFDFERSFVTSAELVRRLGMQRHRLLERLIAGGVKPLVCSLGEYFVFKRVEADRCLRASRRRK